MEKDFSKNKVIVNLMLGGIISITFISIFLGIKNSIKPHEENLTREQLQELDLEWLTTSSYKTIEQLNTDFNLLIYGSLNNKGVLEDLIDLESYRIFVAVNNFINQDEHICYRLSFDDCLDTIINNINKEIISYNRDNNYMGIYNALIRYEAIRRIRERKFNIGNNFTLRNFPINTVLELISVIENENKRRKDLEKELYNKNINTNEALQQFRR